ncbi:MAG: type II toxin-antitoxin system RelE/ParE family toxin [Deltaproteobacteria bacterium]|nr:type II toxin-antitoxin system RelE/ParE family toxin [Deltaproteobacteria bacterium]MBW1796194.1 type II toxin-antitoxin system RelE/ParE family toxin [Deltaproteobacteria bacterium]
MQDRPLPIRFYKTASGGEPVRAWLKSLPREERKIIGDDMKMVQFGWPLGMPLVRKIEPDLWEVRSRLKNKIARVLFTIHKNQIILLLHGLMKKDQKLPLKDKNLAKQRLAKLRGAL